MTKWLFPVIAAVGACGLSSCSGGFGSAENPTGTGPFDSRGNYVEAWADNPNKWNGRSVPKPSEPTAEKKPTAVAQNTTPPVVAARPQTTTVSNTPPKPKPVAKPKPKPKPKPRTTVHTVRKGDTLYGLAKRYGTTVGKIQKANGISGSMIRVGQKVKIPR